MRVLADPLSSSFSMLFALGYFDEVFYLEQAIKLFSLL
jgi:hypothetical protein